MKKILVICALILSVSVVFPQGIFKAENRKPTALDFYEQGKDQQESQNWYRATELFQEALRLNSSNVDARSGRERVAKKL